MKLLITGVTGSLGRAVLAKLLARPGYEIIGYSRDEKKQSEIPSHERLTLVLGDVRDQRRLTESSRGCDLIMHFAALKRVDTMEANPEECIQTNVEGTINVLGAQRTNKIQRVTLSSTDKACKPINVYGYSKALAEKLVLRNKNNVVVRYGNVLASRGSAIPTFIDAIKSGKRVDITDMRMTRFFMPIEDAADFVIESSAQSLGGLKIKSDMKSCHITDLIEALAEIMKRPSPEINLIGMRPGEKLHEDLVHGYEEKFERDSRSNPFSRDELRRLLSPIVEATQ